MTIPHENPGSANKRSARLVALLQAIEGRGIVQLTDLAHELGASAATIRRDVATLSEQGLVVRTHGAVRSVGPDHELPIGLRDARNRAAKRAIAAAVLELLPHGRHAISLTGGTTTAEVMRALHDRHDMTILTNSITLALEAAHQGQSRVLIAGGVLRPNSQELVGSLTESTFGQVNVGTAIVGCDGIGLEGGVTTHDDVEARTNHAMILRAKQVIVVADGSKIGTVTLAKLADLNEVDVLVTDESADPGELEMIRAAGVRIIVVTV